MQSLYISFEKMSSRKCIEKEKTEEDIPHEQDSVSQTTTQKK